MSHQKRLLLAAFLNALPAISLAHDPRPLYVEVDTRDSNTTSVRWKTPASIDYGARPTVVLSEPCQPHGELLERRLSDSFSGERNFLCPKSMAEVSLEIHYPQTNPSLATVVRRLSSDGSDQALLQPGVTSWSVGAEETDTVSLTGYLQLGITHIFSGLDHLLFLICLVLLAITPRRVIVAITGFTLAHSVTLALATLGFVVIPLAFVEALIALSIVFLAADIVRDKRSALAWRQPGIVAFLFGLLHGFGFANVLTHIGLPQGPAAAALLLFNLGVEIGQLAFLAVIMLIAFTVRRLWRARPAADKLARQLIASGCGVVAAFWTIERIVAFG